jgi:Enoyl-(Acyl carrier protein) reductase
LEVQRKEEDGKLTRNRAPQQGRGSADDSGGGAGRRQDEAGCPGQLALVPGPMETPLLDWLLHATPPGPERTQELMLAARFGRPDEFGALACFLASAASSYITGADLPLDGGGSAG